jgi:hypothetical protein
VARAVSMAGNNSWIVASASTIRFDSVNCCCSASVPLFTRGSIFTTTGCVYDVPFAVSFTV